jgi:membrane associated rhomboid family serine protease
VSGTELFVVCKSCGSEVSAYITECPYCGQRLRKRAPKLDRPGAPPRQPRGARLRGLRPARPRLGRLQPGEMPGIRYDTRPYATGVLVVASVVVGVVLRSGWLSPAEIEVRGPLFGEWWRVFTALFAYENQGHLLCAMIGVGLFGWLMERRHGWWAPLLLFVVGGALGMLATVAVEAVAAVAWGATAAAMAILAAWAVPDLQQRRHGEETDSDMLGVAVIAATLLLLPLAVPEADPVANAVGALTGLVLGLPLARLATR